MQTVIIIVASVLAVLEMLFIAVSIYLKKYKKKIRQSLCMDSLAFLAFAISAALLTSYIMMIFSAVMSFILFREYLHTN